MTHRIMGSGTRAVKMAMMRYERVKKESPAGEKGGPRSHALADVVRARGGVKDVGAVIGSIGRKKYGTHLMAQWAAAGRKR